MRHFAAAIPAALLAFACGSATKSATETTTGSASANSSASTASSSTASASGVGGASSGAVSSTVAASSSGVGGAVSSTVAASSSGVGGASSGAVSSTIAASSSGVGGASSGAVSSSASAASSSGGDAGTTSDGGGADGGQVCPTSASLVYVLGSDNSLWSFDPPTKTLTKVAVVTCATPSGAAPNSMAIDNTGTAWVNYVTSNGLSDTAGYIYKVSTTDGSCEAKAAVTLTPPAWYRVGMGFSADLSGSASETLYVDGSGTQGQSNPPGLGSIDLSTGAVVPIGQFTGTSNSLAGQSADLTGTGDGRLFGFFTTNPVQVAQIDETTGATPPATEAKLAGIPTPAAWAFAFWGGDFYLFTSPDGTTASTITQYDPATNTVTSYLKNIGFVAVGAGVAICAPLLAPGG